MGLESIWKYLSFLRFSSIDSIWWHIAMESNTKLKPNRILFLAFFTNYSYSYKRRKKKNNKICFGIFQTKKITTEGICFIITNVAWNFSSNVFFLLERFSSFHSKTILHSCCTFQNRTWILVFLLFVKIFSLRLRCRAIDIFFGVGILWLNI